MQNLELINQLKYRADTFERQDVLKIIETAGEIYMDLNPFVNEEELAEQSLNNLLVEMSKYDRKYIQKAKEKIMEIITFS